MARTRSTYTASPERPLSPRRSPARRPSNDGSEYEMDLDALGLNSTFESSELQASHEPPVDRVETSDIEGPEDFTMNMTYWMTADLPLAQIKSRKEAKGRVDDARMDALHETRTDQIVVESKFAVDASELSMENDEKVRSFLSALPAADMDGAIAGTPLHVPAQNLLQVPRPSPPKARSLQPTVEDYDTPRKPTQETVIHHNTAVLEAKEHDALQEEIVKLRSQLEQDALTSNTRITELETILSYTKSELDAARSDKSRQDEKIASLEKQIQGFKIESEAARSHASTQALLAEKAMDVKLHELSEEMRLQTSAKLQNQRDDFERQIRQFEDSKRLTDQQVKEKNQLLDQTQKENSQLKQANEQLLSTARTAKDTKQKNSDDVVLTNDDALRNQLSSVQTRAEALEKALEKATADARAAREDAERKEAMCIQIRADSRAKVSRIAELETSLQTTKFELECAQTDTAAKHQLFQTNLHLNASMRKLRNDLDAAHHSASRTQVQDTSTPELERKILSLQRQIETLATDSSAKDQHVLEFIDLQEQSDKRLNTAQGRIDSFDATVTSLRQQLAQAQRESARAQADAERHGRDLEDANDRLQDVRADTDRRIADMDQKLSILRESKTETERRCRDLQSQRDDLVEGHEAILEDIRNKAEDAVLKAGALLEQERREKRRIMTELTRSKSTIGKLQTEAEQRHEESESSDDESLSSDVSKAGNKKNNEVQELREIIRKQVTEVKTLRSNLAASKNEVTRLKSSVESKSDLQTTISSLESQNAILQTKLEDQEAVNAAMDERLASMINKLMKERAKTVVGKRDGQWIDSVVKVHDEREMLGKVLLRQWGREEVGIADEKRGESQSYRYKYVK